MRPQILVVHADRSVAGMIAELLDDEGYEAVPLYEAEGWRQLIQRAHTVLAMIDLEFDARTPSWKLASEIRSDPASAHVPIVALTTTPHSVPPRPPNCEVDCEIIAEPFEVDDILATVRSLAAGR